MKQTFIDLVNYIRKKTTSKPAEQQIQVQEKNNAHQTEQNITTKSKRGRKPKQKV